MSIPDTVKKTGKEIAPLIIEHVIEYGKNRLLSTNGNHSFYPWGWQNSTSYSLDSSFNDKQNVKSEDIAPEQVAQVPVPLKKQEKSMLTTMMKAVENNNILNSLTEKQRAMVVGAMLNMQTEQTQQLMGILNEHGIDGIVHSVNQVSDKDITQRAMGADLAEHNRIDKAKQTVQQEHSLHNEPVETPDATVQLEKPAPVKPDVSYNPDNNSNLTQGEPARFRSEIVEDKFENMAKMATGKVLKWGGEFMQKRGAMQALALVGGAVAGATLGLPAVVAAAAWVGGGFFLEKFGEKLQNKGTTPDHEMKNTQQPSFSPS